jgi:hypothetical protein
VATQKDQEYLDRLVGRAKELAARGNFHGAIVNFLSDMRHNDATSRLLDEHVGLVEGLAAAQESEDLDIFNLLLSGLELPISSGEEEEEEEPEEP